MKLLFLCIGFALYRGSRSTFTPPKIDKSTDLNAQVEVQTALPILLNKAIGTEDIIAEPRVKINLLGGFKPSKGANTAAEVSVGKPDVQVQPIRRKPEVEILPMPIAVGEPNPGKQIQPIRRRPEVQIQPIRRGDVQILPIRRRPDVQILPMPIAVGEPNPGAQRPVDFALDGYFYMGAKKIAAYRIDFKGVHFKKDTKIEDLIGGVIGLPKGPEVDPIDTKEVKASKERQLKEMEKRAKENKERKDKEREEKAKGAARTTTEETPVDFTVKQKSTRVMFERDESENDGFIGRDETPHKNVPGQYPYGQEGPKTTGASVGEHEGAVKTTGASVDVNDVQKKATVFADDSEMGKSGATKKHNHGGAVKTTGSAQVDVNDDQKKATVFADDSEMGKSGATKKHNHDHTDAADCDTSKVGGERTTPSEFHDDQKSTGGAQATSEDVDVEKKSTAAVIDKTATAGNEGPVSTTGAPVDATNGQKSTGGLEHKTRAPVEDTADSTKGSTGAPVDDDKEHKSMGGVKATSGDVDVEKKSTAADIVDKTAHTRFVKDDPEPSSTPAAPGATSNDVSRNTHGAPTAGNNDMHSSTVDVTSSTASTPGAGTSAVPDAGTDKVPVAGTDGAPVAGTDKAPVSGTDKAPVAGTDKAPVSGNDKAPISGTDKAPASGSDAASFTGVPPKPEFGPGKCTVALVFAYEAKSARCLANSTMVCTEEQYEAVKDKTFGACMKAAPKTPPTDNTKTDCGLGKVYAQVPGEPSALLYGKRCADNFCPKEGTCVQEKIQAHCCILPRWAPYG